MIWANLKKNKCPQCGADLSDKYNNALQMFTCTCGFKITVKKMTEIVQDKVKQSLDMHFRCPPQESEEEY